MTAPNVAPIDPIELLRSAGFLPAEPPTVVTGGWDTAIWRFTTADGGVHALRLFPSADRLEGLPQECAAMTAAAEHGIPVPLIEANGAWQGRPFLVMSWITGRPLLDYMQARPWSVWRLGREFGRTHGLLHGVPAPALLRADAPGSWVNRVAPEFADLPACLVEEGLRTDALIHLDYHPLNALTDGVRITGIVDWSSGSAGDPRADFARTAAILSAAPLPPSPLRPFFNLFRNLFYRAWRSGYTSIRQFDGDMAPFHAWAGATWLGDIAGRVSDAQTWAADSDVRAASQWTETWLGRIPDGRCSKKTRLLASNPATAR